MVFKKSEFLQIALRVVAFRLAHLLVLKDDLVGDVLNHRVCVSEKEGGADALRALDQSQAEPHF